MYFVKASWKKIRHVQTLSIRFQNNLLCERKDYNTVDTVSMSAKVILYAV